MKVKLCPLCDSEMKKAHYCDVCKSFIWRPEILDVHYHAQERGMGEEDCAYGTNAQNNEPKHDKWKVSSRDIEKNKRQAGGWIGKIVLFIIVLNAINGVIGSHVGDWIAHLLDGNLTYKIEDIIDNLGSDDNDGAQGAVEVNGDYIELSDDEVAKYPNGCNGYVHFEFTEEEADQLITAWAGTEYGRQPDVSLPMTDNYIYHYGESETVYLQKVVCYSLDEDGDDYVMIYSDSVTGRIHSITAAMTDEEKAQSFYLAMVPTLDTAGERSSKEWEMEWKVISEQLESGDGSMSIDNLSVYASKDDDGEIWLTIDPADF